MPDEIHERCGQILECLEAIQEYIIPITQAADFLKLQIGQLHLDAITLRLQVIGENAKQIENNHPHFFWKQLNYDVGYIVRFRDFVSHHYEKLDYEVIFELCVRKLPKFKKVIVTYLEAT